MCFCKIASTLLKGLPFLKPFLNLGSRISIKFFQYSYMATESNWRGVPLTEIYGSQSPWGAPEFPLVAPSFSHAVLYHVPSNGSLVSDRPPKPQIGQDKWDQDNVRMPCSNQNLYPVEDTNGETHLKKRWKIIEAALWKPIRNSQELASTILSYNTKFKNIWKFRALHTLFNDYLEEEESQFFFDVTLPEIAKLALALPKLIQSPIPLLKQHQNRSVSLSQQQIASIMANAFFCTFPRRNTTKKTSEYASYPHINFNTLYECSGSDSIMEKLKCLCHYFRRVCTKVPVGVMTFTRRSVPPRACPTWAQSRAAIASLPLHVDPDNTIEDADGLIQVDFANKFIGGGVLGHGCVQEEIRFVICPELMVSMLFTEVLRPNEVLIMIGCERYSKYSGYGSTLHWTGDHQDSTPLDSCGRRRCAVLAVDAAPYSSVVQEYRREMITRELNKSWIGVSFDTDGQSEDLNYPGLATGNWGCGAFGGSPQLKSLVQIMACAQARRPMAYYTFKDNELRDDIINVYNMLARYNVTVGELYKYIIRYSQTDVRRSQLHAFLHQALRDKEKVPSPITGHERMDTSMSDIIQHELSSSLQNEFLNESPDLFSQDEDQSLTEVKIHADVGTNAATSKQTDERTQTSKSEVISEERVTLTSRLFDEMQKLDDASSTLNLSVNNTSLLHQSMDVSINDTDTSVDNRDRTKPDPASELKKRISRKITDYFSKK